MLFKMLSLSTLADLPRKNRNVFALYLIFLLSQAIYSQSAAPTPTKPADITVLELDSPIERRFADGAEKHVYQVTLAADQYLRVTIEQRGVDVAENLSGGAGENKIALQFDADAKPQGREEVEFVAKNAGVYQITIAPKYKNFIAGKYQIKLTDLRAAAENDRLQEQAREMAAEALRLHQARKYDEAVTKTTSAIAALEKAGATKSFFYGLLLLREGNIFFDQGAYADAEKYFLRAVETMKTTFGSEDSRVFDALTNLAVIYNVRGDYKKAEAIFQQVLANQEKTFGENYPAITRTLNNFANLYRRKGDYAKAETMHLRSLAIREKIYGPDQPEVLSPLAGLATIYYEKKDYAKSREMDIRALKISEKSYDADDPRLATYLNNLALVDTELGNYAEAEPMFTRALSILEKAFGADNIRITDELNNLGELYAYKGDYAKSDVFYQRSLKIREKSLPANHPSIAGTLGNIAANYLFQGDYAKAEPLLQRQLTMRETSLGGEHPDTAKTLNSLARLYENKGDLTQAVAYQTRVDQLLEQYNRLNLYAGSETEQLAYFDFLAQQTDQLLSMQMRFPDSDVVRELAATAVLQRKGRVQDILADSLSALRERFNPKDRKLLSDLSDTNSQLAEVFTGGLQKDNQTERQQKVKTLTARQESLESEISRLSAGFYGQEKSLTLAALQAKIPADAVLLEFAVYHPFNLKSSTAKNQYGKPRYGVYVIRQKGAVGYRDLGDAGQLDEAVNALRKALREPKRRDTTELSRAADEKIMQPIRALSGDAKHLLIAPDGVLNLIPFEVLVDGQNHYLIESYSFTYLSSGRDLLRMQIARTSKNKSLIISNPLFGEPPADRTAKVDSTRKTGRRSVTAARDLSDTYFAPLGGTLQEARSIQTLFPEAVFLTASEATETALKQTVAPRILHIATHGFFLEDTGELKNAAAPKDAIRSSNVAAEFNNPLLRSGLAFAGANQRNGSPDDGVLTALEASGLNLWGTKLVVLSACDTGLGEVKNGEGVYGLRRAFTLAGTESLVMSLWSVSDNATRELMTNYYKNLKQGIGRGESLRQVQLEMLKKNNRRHPFYWAAFIQSGEWANLDGKR